MKKQKKRIPNKISIEDYIKAVKKADREIQLEKSAGWVRTTNIHKNKKLYTRKNKQSYLDE